VLAQSKTALDELQKLADERVRAVVQAALAHVQNLQSEVKRLQARVEELETKLVSLGRRRRTDSESLGKSSRPPPPGTVPNPPDDPHGEGH
jgi:hypothetical protein